MSTVLWMYLGGILGIMYGMWQDGDIKRSGFVLCLLMAIFWPITLPIQISNKFNKR